jgi:hypothetical protein
MKKTILTIVACTCLASSCICIPRKIKKAFTYCYTNTYTGIDTLINIEGYHFNSLLFYDNGLVVRPISRNTYYLRFKEFSFLNEIAENPETKESKSFYNFADCGSYVISGDTIKVQMIHNYHSMNDDWKGLEEWYKIIDRNTLHFLDWFLITTDKKEKEFFKKYYSFPAGGGARVPFVPIPAKPPLDYYWILKEKWFWCNEQDWKDYMEKIKQKKK